MTRQLQLSDIRRPAIDLTLEQAATLGRVNKARTFVYLDPTLETLPGVVVGRWDKNSDPRDVTVYGESVTDTSAKRMVRFLAFDGVNVHWSAESGRLEFYSRYMRLPYEFAGGDCPEFA